ncbi:MAG: hypothetical protein K0Q43_110 [Ramlibacter sp.]|nr:hypothetical protein [Ramlibacter sp.]
MDLQTQAPISLPASDEEYGENAVALDLREHQIGYVVPPNSLVRGEVLLSSGALIIGSFCGRLVCSHGSVIIKKGATFEGEIEADQVWIDGEIRPMSANTVVMLSLLSRSTPPGAAPALAGLSGVYTQRLVAGSLSRIVGRECIAVSNAASGKADIASKSFAVHGKNFAARYLPLPNSVGV